MRKLTSIKLDLKTVGSEDFQLNSRLNEHVYKLQPPPQAPLKYEQRDLEKKKKTCIHWASLMAQWVKNLPAMQETQEMQIHSLGQEDPLEEEMATPSRTLAWEIQWTEESRGLQSKGSQRVGHDQARAQS